MPILIFSLSRAGTEPEFERKASNYAGESRPRSKSLDDMISAVHQYLDRQGHLFLKELFDRFAEVSCDTAGDVDVCCRLSGPAVTAVSS
jgi:hypothetical protein